ncbi:MAG: hypothetical protein FVQ83_14865 [Chloroflexi bacterium]|nr:hypothetical protein [Chloroflexota bacterium]
MKTYTFTGQFNLALLMDEILGAAPELIGLNSLGDPVALFALTGNVDRRAAGDDVPDTEIELRLPDEFEITLLEGVVAAHDYSIQARSQVVSALKMSAKAEFSNYPQWLGWDKASLESWITDNVEAEFKASYPNTFALLSKMAHVLLILVDYTFPEQKDI